MILNTLYDIVVEDPGILNKYKPFSSEVYGETSYNLVNNMIDSIGFSRDDVFIDLGSGVGQVVLQMAGALELKSCLGIEVNDVRSNLASKMDARFREVMKWLCFDHNHFELMRGCFLDEIYRNKIASATIVFVNNFAFDSNLNQQLKVLLAELPDGVKIISSSSLDSRKPNINQR